MNEWKPISKLHRGTRTRILIFVPRRKRDYVVTRKRSQVGKCVGGRNWSRELIHGLSYDSLACPYRNSA